MAARQQQEKTDRIWSPRKWKLYLLCLWAAGTAFWVPVAAERNSMGFVYDTYRLYWYYEEVIAEGRGNPYYRNGYRRAEANLRRADPYLKSFLLSGVAVPLVLLGAGAWLLRNAR